MVVIRIEVDDQLVRRERIERSIVAIGVEQLISSREGCDYACGLAESCTDVESLVVVQHAHFHWQRCWRAFCRLILPKSCNGRRLLPGRVVELAVNYDGPFDPCCICDRRRSLSANGYRDNREEGAAERYERKFDHRERPLKQERFQCYDWIAVPV